MGDKNAKNNLHDKGDEKAETKVKPRKQRDKFRYSGTLARLLSLFTVLLNELSVQIFNFRWQAFQFDECKKLLQKGDALFIIDFARIILIDGRVKFNQDFTHENRLQCIHSLFTLSVRNVGIWLKMK